MTVNCPTCEEQALDAIKIAHGVIHQCPACGFFLIDFPTLDTYSDDKEKCRAALAETSALRLATSRSCPKCSQRLQQGRVRSLGIILTFCPACSALWTDFRSLFNFDKVLERGLRAQVEAAPRPEPISGEGTSVEIKPSAFGRFLKSVARKLDQTADKLGATPHDSAKKAIPARRVDPVAPPIAAEPAKPPRREDAVKAEEPIKPTAPPKKSWIVEPIPPPPMTPKIPEPVKPVELTEPAEPVAPPEPKFVPEPATESQRVAEPVSGPASAQIPESKPVREPETIPVAPKDAPKVTWMPTPRAAPKPETKPETTPEPRPKKPSVIKEFFSIFGPLPKKDVQKGVPKSIEPPRSAEPSKPAEVVKAVDLPAPVKPARFDAAPKRKSSMGEKVSAWLPRLSALAALGLHALTAYEFELGYAIVWMLAAWSGARLIRLSIVYPFKSFEEMTVKAALDAVPVTRWKGMPVTLKGRLRTDDTQRGNSWFLMDSSAEIAVDRQPARDMVHALFGVSHLKPFAEADIVLRGWLRGGRLPYFEILEVRGEALRRKSLVRPIHWIASIIMLVFAVLILASGY